MLASPTLGRYHRRLMNDVTQLLSALEQGDSHAASGLLPLVYDELRKLAAQRMAQDRLRQTLQPSGLRRIMDVREASRLEESCRMRPQSCYASRP